MLALAVLAIIVIAILFYISGRSRAMQVVDGELAQLHSRPSYHGLLAGMWSLLIGILLLIVLSQVWASFNDQALLSQIRGADPSLREIEAELVLSDAKSLTSGNIASRVDDLRESTAASFGSMDFTRKAATAAISILGALAVGWSC